MKILLINPSWGGKMRSQRYNRRWPPLDMLNLAAILQNYGHFVVLHDARADELSPNRLYRLTAAADRVVVNTSPLDRWQCPNLDLTHLVRLTRSIPPEKLILCGVHGTLFPSRMAELTGARVIMSGEPEVSGPALFSALDQKSPLSGVPGIHWTEGGKIESGPPAPLADLCAMPLPAYSLVRPEMYEYELLGKKLAVLETARGCPNRCAFCLKTMYGSRVRMKDPIQVASELELVRSLGFRNRLLHRPRIYNAAGKDPRVMRDNPQVWFALVLPDSHRCCGRSLASANAEIGLLSNSLRH